MGDFQDSNVIFLKEIEKRPCLYNSDIPEYTRKSAVEKAWKEVAEIMNMSEEKCKSKWKNLRTVFTRYMRQVSSGSRSRKRPYYLMNTMKFALPYIKILSVKDSVPTEDEEDITEYEECDVKNNEIFLEDSSPQRSPLSSTQHNESNQSPKNPLSESTSYLRPAMTFPSTSFDNYNMIQTPNPPKFSKESLKNLEQTEIDNSDLQNDAKKMFLLSLLPDVHAMTDAQMRKFKREVLNVISEILD